MRIYWTYSKKSLKPSEIAQHEKGKIRFSNEKYHIGGLNRMVLLTHCICSSGQLHTLNYCPGDEINLALIGGVDDDYIYKNTITTEQLKTLGNICRFYLSLGQPILEGDLSNFDLPLWLKAINK